LENKKDKLVAKRIAILSDQFTSFFPLSGSIEETTWETILALIWESTNC
jgi:hypothetical protein